MEFNKAYNRAEFLSFLRTSFLPEDFQQEASVIDNPVQFQYTQQVTRLGECESLGLVVYEVRHSSKHDARVGLTKEAFRLLADEYCECALVFFVPKDDDSNYRFSLIEITLDQSEESSRISRRYSNPHRYSYFLGKGIAYYTPNKYLNEYGRVVSVEDLRNRFSVEVLTKAFYQELSDWYAWAIMVVRFPNDLTTLEDNQKYNSEAMIRLITRLIFVWFLKQRHLVPDEFFDEQFIANELIQGFTPHAETTLFGKSYDSKYYKGVLQNLFFAMLNSPITPEGKDTISERRFRNGRGDYDNNKLMRHEDLFINPDKFVELANKYVPFLNGGLFDCLDDKDKGIYIDAFTDRKAISGQLVIPDFLFFGDEVGKNIDLSEWYGDKKKKKVSARGIIDILKRYNFTVEENTPFDQEVSLDPELLGKVFENLLAAYNPETQTTARKQTGSFYTPREIVQYMVDESLVAHLKRTVGEDLEPEYRKLIQYTDEELQLTDEQKRQIMQSLYDCKVLDPACGSGAFPMGMLQQMVHILGQLDPNNEQWKDMMLSNAISETSEAYHNATDEERAEIVADIERSFNESINRPDYARKLYLIENCIYGVDIQPIAIQISKLRFFISLVVDQKTNNNPVDNFGIRPLPNLEAKFVAANTLIGLEKKESTLFDSEDIKEKEKELVLAQHKIFGAKTVKTKRKYKDKVVKLRSDIANMLQEANYIRNEEAVQLAGWDMFDQNNHSPFFDSEWMFGLSNGFDIVVANPPYVFTRDVDFSDDFKTYIEKEYFSKIVSPKEMRSKEKQSGKINLFAVFILKGLLLCKENGILNYILPNNILRTTVYDIIRKSILENNTIQQIVDLGSGVFENVTASTIIMQIINHQNLGNKIEVISNVKSLENRGYDTNYVAQDQFQNNTSYTFSIYGNDTNSSIIKKIESAKYLLGDLCLCISPGIDGKKEKYVSKIQHSDQYKKLLFGKNIKKYHIHFDDYYICYDRKLLNRARKESIFLSEKVITQRISGGDKPIVAAYDNDKFYTFNSVNNIILKNTDVLDYKVLTAILNSNVVNWYYSNSFSNKSSLTVNISKTFLAQIPIPSIPKEVAHTINKLVSDIIEHSIEDISSYDNLINKLAYKLYHLTYDEVLIVDPETQITRQEYETE